VQCWPAAAAAAAVVICCSHDGSTAAAANPLPSCTHLHFFVKTQAMQNACCTCFCGVTVQGVQPLIQVSLAKNKTPSTRQQAHHSNTSNISKAGTGGRHSKELEDLSPNNTDRALVQQCIAMTHSSAIHCSVLLPHHGKTDIVSLLSGKPVWTFHAPLLRPVLPCESAPG
jgi:hypothetical protein